MKQRNHSHSLPKQGPRIGTRAKILGLLLSGSLLGACQTMGPQDRAQTAEFRMDRYEEMQRIQGFEQCSQEGLLLDTQARERASTGAFLTSARVLEGCVEDSVLSASAIPEQKRMQVHAMAVLNYFKGGDVDAARRSFDAFKASYTGRDLYFGDSASFIETMDVLLGRTAEFRIGQFAALNVNDALKREVRRVNYWKNK